MLARYIRFRNAVMQPGPSGVTLENARVKSKADEQPNAMAKREAIVQEIDVEPPFVILRALRNVSGGKSRLYTRVTPFENCVDFEPLDDEPDPKKGPTR